MASELLYSAQLSSLGITALPEPLTPAETIWSRLNFWPNLAISELTTVLGLEVILSTSSWTMLLFSSMSDNLALTEPTSKPREYFILYKAILA